MGLMCATRSGSILPCMPANVARTIDAAIRSLALLERVTRSMVHTDPTAAKSIGAIIHIPAGVIGDSRPRCLWDAMIRQSHSEYRPPKETIATSRRLTV